MNKEKDFLSGAELVCFDLDDTLVRGIHSMMYLAILVQKFPQFMRFEQMRNQFPSFLHGERAKLRLAKGLEISVIEARFAKHFKQLRNIKETVDRFHKMRCDINGSRTCCCGRLQALGNGRLCRLEVRNRRRQTDW